jgi:hypothetical protein
VSEEREAVALLRKDEELNLEEVVESETEVDEITFREDNETKV